MSPPAAQRPEVYSIAPGIAFVDALAAGLFERLGRAPENLAAATVLLPTRRACRSLADAFLRAADGEAMLLPRLVPLGDVDEDDLMLEGLDSITGGAPAIGGLKRQLLLARLVMARDAQTRPEQAAQLARELARLLDQVQTERSGFEHLADLAGGDFADHWNLTVDFLKLVSQQWPKILAAEGAIDPARRRDQLLSARAQAWRGSPPGFPIIAAGSTGSIPATADLLSVVARLPLGCVVLPGLDLDMDEAARAAVDETHPQFGMIQLLDHMGVRADDVADWPAPGMGGRQTRLSDVRGSRQARARVINRALLPAPATGSWRSATPPPDDALKDVQLVTCPGPAEEAGVIALALRQAVDVGGVTAALVTPDRGLARRVAAALRRWHIEADDSAGQPLAQTAPGAFLRLTAQLVAGGFQPVDLLAAAKHPLAAAGQNPGGFRAAVRRLEITALRGARPGPGLTGIRAALGRHLADHANLLENIEAATQAFATLCQSPAPVSPKALITAHVACAEALAASDAESGAERLWRHQAGEAAAIFVADLAENADILQPMAAAGYAALLDTLMGGIVVRPRHGLHPRVHIWGLLEARLQHADLVVLGGLNEGTWPPDAPPNPWMSRPMLKRFGLPRPERRIGLTAHDFVQAFCAPRVLMTRAARVGGTPTVASRWLTRLEKMVARTPLESLFTGPAEWLHWQQLLDRPGAYPPPVPPAPRPPVAARPRQLSVTRIEAWMRDPYGIYARYVLGLHALDPLDADPGAADYGSFIHQAIDGYLKEAPALAPARRLKRLLALGRGALGGLAERPGVWAFWWPRFERIAQWVIDQEAGRQAVIAASASEIEGSLTIDGPAGPFTVTAKADRIDRLLDGSLAVIDYKTGGVPSTTEVIAGFAPQLPLEAAIAQAGGFGAMGAGPVSALEYWRLTGGQPAGEIKTAVAKDTTAAALADEALQGVAALVRVFDDPDTPYEARPSPNAAPRYSDYEHLARVGEWARSGRDGGDGE